MSQLSDTMLIARVVAFNDSRAFGRLVERHQSAIRRFFIHQTYGNTALTDDLAQETFVRAYQHIRKFQSLSGFSTWLHRIAYNVLQDHWRHARPTEPLEGSAAEHTPVAPADTDRQTDLERALAQLNANERLCLTLFYMEDKSIEQITQITAMPEGTVKSHLARGKKHLATWLTQHGYGK